LIAFFSAFISEEGSLLGLAISAFLSSTLLPGGSELLLLWLVEQGESSLWVLLKGFERFRHRAPPSGRLVDTVKRWGYPVLLLSWLPVVGDGLCLAAGWLQLRWLPSLLIIFIGKALRYWLLIYAIDIIKIN